MAEKKNLIKLLESANENFKKIYKAIDNIDSFQRCYEAVPEEEEEMNNDQLRFNLIEVYRKLCVLYDAVGLQSSLEEMKREFLKYESSLTNIEWVSYYDVIYSKPNDMLHSYYENLSLLLDSKDNDSLIQNIKKDEIRKTLKSTPRIIYESKLEPKNEADVKKEVRRVLSYSFPDTVSEMNIPKTVKTFKPDIGIKSLSLAIEYKYATSAEEVKTCIGGISEDVSGYANSKEWTNFIGVLYLTEAFFTDDQIQEQFRQNAIPSNWEIITVYGRGTRKKKSDDEKKKSKDSN